MSARPEEKAARWRVALWEIGWWLPGPARYKRYLMRKIGEG